jgi:hypothetical protein
MEDQEELIDSRLSCVNSSQDEIEEENKIDLKDYSWIARLPNTAFSITLGLVGNAILFKNLSMINFTEWVGPLPN